MFEGEVLGQNGVSQRTLDAIDIAAERIKQPGDVFTPLCKAMRAEQSDKGRGPWGKHNYTQVYFELFAEQQDSISQIFEVGLGTNFTDTPSNMGAGGTPGASLRGWRAFFPNASIYGADVDRRILFEEERIKTFYIDQLDRDTISLSLSIFETGYFDFIMDDGLHTFIANKNLYENANRYVKDGGYYIIEDINASDRENVNKFRSYLEGIERPFIIYRLPHQRDITDNCIAIIEH